VYPLFIHGDELPIFSLKKIKSRPSEIQFPGTCPKIVRRRLSGLSVKSVKNLARSGPMPIRLIKSAFDLAPLISSFFFGSWFPISFQGKSADGADHRFQHIVRVLTVRQTAKVIDPPACFGRNPFDAVSAEFVPVVGDNIVLDVEALRMAAASGVR
jgi:hypothetical protein